MDIAFVDRTGRSLGAAVLRQHTFQRFILALIVINAAVLGLQTSPAVVREAGELVSLVDRCIVGVFVLGIGLRLHVQRLQFYRDAWNVFDLVVIGTASIPANEHFAVLRALRVLRVLRVVTVMPAMRRVVGALLAAIPGLSAIACVLLLLFYVFAVIGTHIFGEVYPAWFGNVGRSLYTLFQVMTLESWSMGISRPVMEAFPYAWAFFIPFILIATFTMLNLFIAFIVTATQNYTDAEREETIEAVKQARDEVESQLHGEVRLLRAEISALAAQLRERADTR